MSWKWKKFSQEVARGSRRSKRDEIEPNRIQLSNRASIEFAALVLIESLRRTIGN